MSKADKRKYSRILLVEGTDDLYSITHLMRFYVEWPSEPANWPVYVDASYQGVGPIVDALPVELKASHVRSLGVVLDADRDPAARYQSVRARLSGVFPSMPLSLPSSGLVVSNEEMRFGLWLMPDNVSDGSLETFLKFLVPYQQMDLWQFACDSTREARLKGAAYRDTDLKKAELQAWLSWQDPPGQNPGPAIARKALDPSSPNAAPFVRWFRELFQI